MGKNCFCRLGCNPFYLTPSVSVPVNYFRLTTCKEEDHAHRQSAVEVCGSNIMTVISTHSLSSFPSRFHSIPVTGHFPFLCTYLLDSVTELSSEHALQDITLGAAAPSRRTNTFIGSEMRYTCLSLKLPLTRSCDCCDNTASSYTQLQFASMPLRITGRR